MHSKLLCKGITRTDNDIIQTSNEISEPIVKKLKPHKEGEFVKESASC